jgi:hypothetical protein
MRHVLEETDRVMRPGTCLGNFAPELTPDNTFTVRRVWSQLPTL